MRGRILKTVRVVAALIFLILYFLIFLDITSSLQAAFIGYATYIQFIPSMFEFIESLALASAGFLFIILFTVLLGRVYCSFLCPLGIFQDVFLFLKRKFKKKTRYAYLKPYHAVRYGILFVTVLLWMAGSAFLIIILDPYSIFGRVNVMLFKPAIAFVNNLISRILVSFDNYTLIPVDIKISGMFPLLVTAAFLSLILWMSLRFGRMYCTHICPLGTFLGIFSRFSVFRIHINRQYCNSCGKCALECKAGCIDSRNRKVDLSRCIACYNCLDTCPENGITYGLKRPSQPLDTHRSRPDLNKRKFLAEAGLLIASALSLHHSAFSQYGQREQRRRGRRKEPIPVSRDHPVIPPGAESLDNYNSQCTACYLCVSACPTNVIQPALFAFGWKGVLQPHMDFNLSFCNFDCTRCGEICPTGAIKPLDVETKKRTQLGKAEFIKQNCIVYLDDTDCGACSEHCPTKAVDMEPFRGTLMIPYVRPEICIGCGACEYACPTDPKSIFVNGNPEHVPAEKPKAEQLDAGDTEDFPF
ncbi:MAG: 4Fe-4S binding protein [Bacteroidales bacterium]